MLKKIFRTTIRSILAGGVLIGIFVGITEAVKSRLPEARMSEYYALEKEQTIASAKKQGLPLIHLGAANTITLRGIITSHSAAKLIADLYAMSGMLSKKSVIYLVLDSSGGEVDAGNTIIDAVRSLPQHVHTITISAFSMAAHIAQALGIRYIIPSGEMMLHRIRVYPNHGLKVPGELENYTKFFVASSELVDKRTAKRLKMPYKKYLKMIWSDHALTSKQAIARNWADKLVLIRCGRDLLLRQNRVLSDVHGIGIIEKYSGCPLIRKPLES